MKRIMAGLLLLILSVWFLDTYACEEDHAFFRVAAGKQGQWLSDNDGNQWNGKKSVAAVFELGYRAPVQEWLWVDIKLEHHSAWDYFDKDEDELDALTIGMEIRFY